MDHGNPVGVSDCSAGLFNVMATDVIFADTMAHGTLLGVAIAGALSLPLWLGELFGFSIGGYFMGTA